jgi:hypothetical protein
MDGSEDAFFIAGHVQLYAAVAAANATANANLVAL